MDPHYADLHYAVSPALGPTTARGTSGTAGGAVTT